MPRVTESPDMLRPFLAHGVDLKHLPGQKQGTGDCPFCAREGRFYVNVDTGLFDCKFCLAHGNTVSFLRQLHEASRQSAGNFQALALNRGLLYLETLNEWGIVNSATTGEWLVPGYGGDQKLKTLYRYIPSQANTERAGRWFLMATPGQNQQLFLPTTYNPEAPDVYVAEGVWDACALWETMSITKADKEGNLFFTGEPASSLLAHANVIGVPSCNVFHESFLPLFAGKNVALMYDNDHPRKHPDTGNLIPPAGYEGMKRVAQMLAHADTPPRSIQFLNWGGQGKDHSNKLPHGTDVRDILTSTEEPNERIQLLQTLLSWVKPIPADWVGGRSLEEIKKGGAKIECKPCQSWKTLTNAAHKCIELTDGLDRALSVMYACILSTRAVGDQLWVKIISPPGGGKTTLCEAVSVARKYVRPLSLISGFHSGYKTDREGKEDNSLLAQMKDMTMITKDGDTLIKNPNLGKILSQARDIYDRNSRSFYLNKQGKDYEGLNMTWILCGTSSLRQLDNSELGQRFLDCVILHQIDDDEEERIGAQAANQAEYEMSFESNGRAESMDSPEMTAFKQLAGGYVEYLRENAQSLINGVSMSEQAKRICQRLGQFTAFMRSRPSIIQDEDAERELSYRLIKQLVRLAKCLAVVLNRRTVDEEIMRRVRQVAMDTSRGKTLDIVGKLEQHGGGLTERGLLLVTGEKPKRLQELVYHLGRIRVLEYYKDEANSRNGEVRWRMTDRFRKLYYETFQGEVIL